jgi:hypothetical protein
MAERGSKLMAIDNRYTTTDENAVQASVVAC